MPSHCRSAPKEKVCCERPKISAHAHMHEGITYYILHIRTHDVRRKCHNEFCTRRVSVLSVFKTACTRLLYVYVFVCVCVVVEGITTQKRCRRLGPGRSYTVYTNDPFTPVQVEKVLGEAANGQLHTWRRKQETSRPAPAKGRKTCLFPPKPHPVPWYQGR